MQTMDVLADDNKIMLNDRLLPIRVSTKPPQGARRIPRRQGLMFPHLLHISRTSNGHVMMLSFPHRSSLNVLAILHTFLDSA